MHSRHDSTTGAADQASLCHAAMHHSQLLALSCQRHAGCEHSGRVMRRSVTHISDVGDP
jgi:hypothetical protein